MADRYWRGGTANWDSTAGSKWAETPAGATGASVPTTADDVFFDSTSTGTCTISTGNTGAKSINCTGFTGTLAGIGAISVAGGVTLVAAMGFTYTGTLTLTGTGTLTTAGKTLGPVTVNGAGITVSLGDALTMGSTRTFTFTAGTLNLANFTLSTGLFSSIVTNTRVIEFGTGNITTTGTSLVVNFNGTNFTYTGTPTVNISNNSATSASVNATSGFTETNALTYNVTIGTYSLTMSNTQIRNLNFTGFAGTLVSVPRTVYGNLTIPASGMTLNAGTSVTTFAGTSGTQIITTNGVTVDFPLTQNGVGGTVELNGSLTLGSTRAYTLTNGNLNISAGSLSAGNFSSSNSNARVIAFGSNSITTRNSGTAFNVAGTNLTYTGTPTVNISNNSATATTVTATSFTEITAFNFNVTTGTYTLTVSTSSFFKSLNFTGFTGTWAPTTQTATFYGNLTLVSGMTFTAGTGTWTFANTSGTAILTSAGKTIYAITASTPGATLAFSDAATLSNALTFTSGTLQLPASTTTTVGSFVTTGTTTKFLTSSISGTQATISKASGATTVTFLSIQDSNAVGGTWDATAISNTNNGNNTGWSFGEVVVSGSNFFLMFG
jgi:hypothetical protein